MPATIVLLTVNDHETAAVLDAFVGAGRVPTQKTIAGVTYNLLGVHGDMDVVHTIGEMGSGGVGASQQRTREAVEGWQPKAIIAIGIAFGLDETRQKIGDVLVATQTQDYELGRVNHDGTVTPRGDKPHTADNLCNRLRQTDGSQARIATEWPKVRFGLVLSGQKLVDNLDYRRSLTSLFPEAIGGEMEATGLYVSATAAKVDWIVIKSICDWGHDKNQAEKDAWQRLAARNAARVLKAALDAGALYSGEGSRNACRAGARAIWQEKLEFLQAEEAKASDPDQKFKLKEGIVEAKAKLAELANVAMSPKPNDHPSGVPPAEAVNTGATVPGSAYSPENAAYHIPFPAKGSHLVGRQKALEGLLTQLCAAGAKHPGRASLFGIGGLGKTQLAADYSHLHRDAYPGGIYWLDVGQDLDGQLTRLCDLAGWLNPTSEHAEKLAVARQRLLTHPGSLLVFDNVENVSAIKLYLPETSSRNQVLVLGRSEQPGWPSIGLFLLQQEESLRLLQTEAERQFVTHEEEGAARTIADQLGGLPLALELVGAYLRRRPATSWASAAADLQQRGLKARSLDWAKFEDESLTQHGADLHAALCLDEPLVAASPLLRPLLDLLAWAGAASIGEGLLCDLLRRPEPGDLSDAIALGEQLRILSIESGVSGERRLRMHRLVQQVRQQDLPRPHGEQLQRECLRLGDHFARQREDFQRLLAYEAEIPHLHAYQEHARQSAAWPAVVRLCWLEAYPSYHRGQYAEAQRIVRDALDLYEQWQVHDQVLEAHLRCDLASTSTALGDYQEALRLGRESLAIRRDVLGDQHVDTAMAIGNLGTICAEMGDYREALRLESEALILYRALQGEKHPATARAVGNLVGIHLSLGDYREALRLAKESLAIRREVLGEDHPATAHATGNLAIAYQFLGEYEQAQKLAENTLAIRREVLGEMHPDTAKAIMTLGGLCHSRGNYREALRLKQAGLELLIQILGERHPSSAVAMVTFGSTHDSLGKYDQAVKWTKRGLAILLETLGEKHPNTLDAIAALGATRFSLGESQEALRLANDVLKLRREVAGEKHPRTATAICNLGMTYFQLGRHDDALKLLREVVALRREILGVKHPDTAKAMGSMGTVCCELKDYQGALTLQKESLMILQEVLGAKHPETAMEMQKLEATYSAMGEGKKSLNLAKESLAILQEVLGEVHPTTATAMSNLAEAYRRLGKRQEALGLAKKTLAIRLDVLGESHHYTTNIRSWIARCLVEMGRALDAKHAVEEWLRAVPRDAPAFNDLMALRKQLLDTKGHPLRPGFRQRPNQRSRGRHR